jgi:hypothetical protein
MRPGTVKQDLGRKLRSSEDKTGQQPLAAD